MEKPKDKRIKEALKLIKQGFTDIEILRKLEISKIALERYIESLISER